mmetsp:Transcript_13819/g.34809  ORF Transcript_13819/g.34809 Transcript_13819/m.34809 type:complete len:349 (-) Transcript_13819:421-1467(-)
MASSACSRAKAWVFVAWCALRSASRRFSTASVSSLTADTTRASLAFMPCTNAPLSSFADASSARVATCSDKTSSRRVRTDSTSAPLSARSFSCLRRVAAEASKDSRSFSAERSISSSCSFSDLYCCRRADRRSHIADRRCSFRCNSLGVLVTSPFTAAVAAATSASSLSTFFRISERAEADGLLLLPLALAASPPLAPALPGVPGSSVEGDCAGSASLASAFAGEGSFVFASPPGGNVSTSKVETSSADPVRSARTSLASSPPGPGRLVSSATLASGVFGTSGTSGTSGTWGRVTSSLAGSAEGSVPLPLGGGAIVGTDGRPWLGGLAGPAPPATGAAFAFALFCSAP